VTQLPYGRYGRFQVIGHRQYRGHQPTEEFEARIDAPIERAIWRREIRLVELIDHGLPEGGYRLPRDWPPKAADTRTNRGAARRLSH